MGGNGVVNFLSQKESGKSGQQGRANRGESARGRKNKLPKRFRGHCHRPPPKPPLLRELEKRGDVKKTERGRRGGKKNAKPTSKEASQGETSESFGSRPHGNERRDHQATARELGSIFAQTGHDEPLPLQERCWEAWQANRNALLIAPAASGKTLAYLVPAAAESWKQTGNSSLSAKAHKFGSHSPAALIVVPSRELAQQVASIGQRLAANGATCVHGGVDVDEQVYAVMKRPGIVVGTPGRLEAMSKSGVLDLARCSFVALDEVDKLLAHGLQSQLEALKERLVSRKVSMLASATLPQRVRSAASAWLGEDCLFVRDGDHKSRHRNSTEKGEHKDGSELEEELGDAHMRVSQTVHVCAQHKKHRKLLRHLTNLAQENGGSVPRCAVFVNKRVACRLVSKMVFKHGHRSITLHGGMPQEKRDAALSAFRKADSAVLVATDVAGRGLDVEGLRHVVNWDMPPNLQQYLHRVGRAGRQAGERSCSSFTFFTRNFAPLAPGLVRLLEATNQHPLDPNLIHLASMARSAGISSDRAVIAGDEEEEEEEEDELELERKRASKSDIAQESKKRARSGGPDTGLTPSEVPSRKKPFVA